MNITNLKRQLLELVEQVSAFLGRGTSTQAYNSFKEHREALLKQIPEMGELLKTQPVYGAIAFLGKFQFEECPDLLDLEKGSSPEKLANLLGTNAIKVAVSANPAWEFLLKHDKEVLCTILALCFIARKNPTIKRALKSP